MTATSAQILRRRLVMLTVGLAILAAGIAEQPAILGLTGRDPDAAILSAIVWMSVGAYWTAVAWRSATSLPALWRLPSAVFRGGLVVGSAAIVVGRVGSAVARASPQPAAVATSLEAALYQMGVVALASLAAFAASRSLLRPALSDSRPPIGARDISLVTRVVVATTGTSFATAGILLNVLIDFDTTPPDALVAFLATAAALVLSSALIGFLVGQDMSRGLEEVTRRMRELARADPGARVEVPIIAADEVGDLTIAASELERRIRREEAAAASTAERTRIARELHDGVAKSVSVLALDVAALAARTPPELRPALARIEHLSSVLAEELRAIVRGSRESDAGIPFADALRRALGADGDVTLETSGDLDRVNALPRFEVLRVLEEAVRNARSHGRPTTIGAQVMVHDGRLRLVVDDDGSGIGRVPWSELASTGHFGLLGIKERATLLGGDVTIGPRPGGGTRLALDVPLDAA